MRTRRTLCGLAVLALAAAPAAADEVLFAAEGNRLQTLGLGGDEHSWQVLIQEAAAGGRDVNGMICFLPDGSGRFVLGEDSGQPDTPAGWGVFEADGTQVGKLTPTSAASVPEPYGCAFDAEGRLFTSELGDPGFGTANGQLILWFPPFDHFPGPAGDYPKTNAKSTNFCTIAGDIGTAGGIAIDGEGRVYVSSAGRLSIRRFSPPFPTAPDASGGCGARDALGSPRAERVNEETFVRGPATFSGLAFAANGNLYAASVATGRIYEYDPDGELVRRILTPTEWLPPFSTGSPQGLAVDSEGTLYYADLNLAWSFGGVGPGPDGKIRRIRFDASGEPLPPETLLEGVPFPDGVGIAPAVR